MIRAGVGVSLGVGSRKGRGKEGDLGEAQVGPSPYPEEGYSTFVPPPPWNRCLDVALFHYDAAYSGRKVSDGIDRGSRCQKAFYPL